MYMDVVVDLILSVLYLIELQYNISHFSDIPPETRYRWLYVVRPPVIYHIAIGLSCYNILSLAIFYIFVRLMCLIRRG
jgi:hypothetical protein